jgi:hypothetical protein
MGATDLARGTGTGSGTATGPAGGPVISPGIRAGTSRRVEVEDVDLDQDEPARGCPTGTGRVAALLLVLCLAGLLGAVAVRAGQKPAPVATPPRAVATVEVDATQLNPLPTGVLQVTVYNRDVSPIHAVEVVATGAGIAGRVAVPLDRLVESGSAERVRVEVPLTCGRLVDDSGPPVVSVLLTGADGGRATVATWPTGPRAAEGLCQTALAELPGGWPVPVVLRSFQAQIGAATVSVAALPSGASAAATVRAGSWRLPVLASHGFGPDGVATLTVGRPAPDCAAPSARPVLPVGLEIVVSGPVAGPVPVYVPVGPDLARWLLSAWQDACPAQPVGPPDPDAAGPVTSSTNGHAGE